MSQKFVLATALTGFSGAVYEARERIAPDVQTAVHTGFWGCGAYGGNPTLMPLLQMIAACGSELNKMVFHSGSDSAGYAKALEILEDLLPVGRELALDKLISQVEDLGFEWGVSNGT